MCVSQAEGDQYCACLNSCEPDAPGANLDPTACTKWGLTPPYFDSCFCAKCPTCKPDFPNCDGTDPNQVDQGEVPATTTFSHLCPDLPFQGTPCSGALGADGGCNNSGKPKDGVCVPNDGDSSETCLNP
jgi:hypothetical protein